MGARVIVAAATTLFRVHLVTARAPRNHGLRAGRQCRARALLRTMGWEVWGDNAAPFLHAAPREDASNESFLKTALQTTATTPACPSLPAGAVRTSRNLGT
eukprot:scaffold40319_cov24-Phaeocystis_antarctica.AAC.1